MKNKWKLGVLVLAIVLVAAWYAFRPERLIVNRPVNEDFPGAEVASPAQVVESGTFSGVMHPTRGSATIYRLADGQRILRLTNFKTSNGPDVHVYLVAAADAKDSPTVERRRFHRFGNDQGERGRPKFRARARSGSREVPDGLDLVQKVLCQFGAAPLRADNAILHN